MSNQPPAHVADERAAFEVAYARINHCTAGGGWNDFTNGRYDEVDVHDAWILWQAARAAIPAGADVCVNNAALADAACLTCHGAGQVCVGTSGQESDGNAPVMGPCGECGYFDPIAAGAPAETPPVVAWYADTQYDLNEDKQGDWPVELRTHRAFVFGATPPTSKWNWKPLVDGPASGAPAETPKPVAPWTDFSGALISHGARLVHPDGSTFVAIRLDGYDEEGDAWRAVYDHEPQMASRLCLQIGDKGQAVLSDVAQPAPAPATDAWRLPTLTEMQAIIRKGSLVSNTDAWTIAETVLSMLSANSPREAG